MAVAKPTGPTIEVAPGYKFGVAAVPGSRSGCCPVSLLIGNNGFALSRSLPANALQTWHEDIGRFRSEELAKANLFLWYVAPSDEPLVIGRDTEFHEGALILYVALMLAVPYFNCERVSLLVGGNDGSGAMVRSMQQYDGCAFGVGAPASELDFLKLKYVLTLAYALRAHEAAPHPDRVERAVRTYREAIESNRIDTRLHQFVRCAEAFLLCKGRRDFAARASRVCVGMKEADLIELYDIRSSVEHLHGPFECLPATLPLVEKHRRLLMRCMQAEALARYMVTMVLTSPQLWPHFETMHAIAQFWKLPEPPFRSLWPSRIEMAAVLRSFDNAEFERRVSEDGVERNTE